MKLFVDTDSDTRLARRGMYLINGDMKYPFFLTYSIFFFV